MTHRTYSQACPVAYALDRVGGRWTLLIVRELLFGPRRFKDIVGALPGIGTNLLAARLRSLEREEIVTRTTLPPPAGSSVYQLGPRGESLRPVIQALAAWGLRYMANYPTGDHFGVVQMMSALCALFAGSDDGAMKTCEVHVSGEVFRVSIDRRQIDVAPGPDPRAQLVLYSATSELLRILGQPQEGLAALESGSVSIERGDRTGFEQFLRSFNPLGKRLPPYKPVNDAGLPATARPTPPRPHHTCRNSSTTATAFSVGVSGRSGLAGARM